MAKHEETQFAESVKKMTGEEITSELKTLRDKLYTLRSQSVTEKVEDVSQFGKTKRNIARLLTEQSTRRISGVGEPRAAKAPRKRKVAPGKTAPAKASAGKSGAKARTAAKAPKATAAKSPRKAGSSARSTKSKTVRAGK
jgi:ribosomal protein L29